LGSRSARVSRPRRNARPQVSSSLPAASAREPQPSEIFRSSRTTAKRRPAVAPCAGSGDPCTTECGVRRPAHNRDPRTTETYSARGLRPRSNVATLARAWACW
jgi:hypothetical protein